MPSKSLASTALLLALNLLFFTLVTSTSVPACTPTPPNKDHNNTDHPKPKPSKETCPRDAVKLGVCANVLKSLLNVELGKPPKKPCCSLLEGLVDLEAAVCLCTALKANVLGIVNPNIPISLSLLLNYCGKHVPSGFQCA